MSKLFYDHLIIIEEILVVLDEHHLDPKERAAILQFIDETMHQELLHVILSSLPQQHHETFLQKLHQTPDDTALLELLKDHTPDIEQRIMKRANSIKKAVLKEIHRTKREESA